MSWLLTKIHYGRSPKILRFGIGFVVDVFEQSTQFYFDFLVELLGLDFNLAWRVSNSPARTSWLCSFFPKINRLTESSNVSRATMFCSRNPWQYSKSCIALYTFQTRENINRIISNFGFFNIGNLLHSRLTRLGISYILLFYLL